MCIIAIGAKLRAVYFFPIRFQFLRRSQPLLKSLLLLSLCSQHDLIKLNQISQSHLKKDEHLCHVLVATVIYCTSAYDQHLCDCALNEAWS